MWTEMLTHSEFPLNSSCVKHDSNYVSSHPPAQTSLNSTWRVEEGEGEERLH